jgi:hypothetical protein
MGLKEMFKNGIFNKKSYFNSAWLKTSENLVERIIYVLKNMLLTYNRVNSYFKVMLVKSDSQLIY